MGKDFDNLCKALNKLDGLKIIDTSAEGNWVHFKLSNHSVLQALQSLAQEVAENYPCSLLVLSKEGKPKEFFYQLVFEEAQNSVAAQLLQKKLDNLIKSEGNLVKAKHRELGLPDLSLVTMRQIAAELKRRDGLTFALVWIENTERDNIAIEGSGNPTQLVGLLTRGSHMAIEWADKNIKFFKPKEDE
jgi:hypothetical protein